MTALLNIFPIVQIMVSMILVGLILLQQRGVGLGSAFGGEGGFYRTKRGLEKIIFWLTVVFTGLFLGLTFLNLFL